ncbi:MAG: hypothetical protein ED859_12165 [Desulfuromonadales bacterium]|nr:MAG: hypothetical protein ED859_12165 [Desulfuromonadales bacterium]
MRRNFLRAFVMAVLMVVFTASHGTAAPGTLVFNDSKLGNIAINVFDWLPDNGLAVGAVPLATSPSTSDFDLHFQASLGNFQLNSSVITGTGLHTDYEITIVYGVTATGSLQTGAGGSPPFNSNFFLSPAGRINYFKIYYDTAKNANPLTGTGYNDGILLMSGRIVDISGLFTVFNTTPVPLDQYQSNNYPNVTTVAGTGGSDLRVAVIVDTLNPDYFPQKPDIVSFNFFSNTSQITPFKQVDPAAQFFNGSGFITPTRGTGNINGYPAAQGAADFQFQVDANSSVNVNLCSGTIGDFVWHDLDRNGLQDAGEPGIDGVTVNLKDATNAIIATTTTGVGPMNQHGYYQFTGLCAGEYKVEVITPAGFSPTSPCSADQTIGNDSNCSPATVNLPNDDSSNQTIDFGFVTPCTGTIGDFVWHDQNRNGLQDMGEPGIDGVTVNLRDSANTIIATTTTSVGPGGIHGYYQFTGLCAGEYKVEVITPAGFSPTSPCSADQTIGNDSNCSPATVNLPNDDSSNQTIDFGFVTPEPCIDIEKEISVDGGMTWLDADTKAAAALATAPHGAIYRLIVKNCGTVDLTTVVVTDSTLGVNYPIGNLAAGAMVTLTSTQIPALNQAQRCGTPGDYPNTATVTGKDAAGFGVTDSDAAWLVCTPPPCIDIEKEISVDGGTTWLDADTKTTAASAYAPHGAMYRLIVKNCGTVNLMDVVVTDSTLGVNYPIGNLAAGAIITLTSAQIPALDQAQRCGIPGDYPNTSTVTGKDANGFVVSDSDMAWLVCTPPPTACIGDLVWKDTNRNGIQDMGETGIQGVTVKLYNCGPDGQSGTNDDIYVASQQTDANGIYTFCNLMPGNYYVQFVLPDGYVFSPQDQGTNDSKDSDADQITGRTICTALAPGENDTTWDAGMYKPDLGCTFTQGYWKTHSKYGPAPYDNTWAKLPQGEETPFFGTGKTWYQIITAVPKNGDAYLILAHQYIAAYLNLLNGADTSYVAEAMSHATMLLDTYDGSPNPMSMITGPVRDDFIMTAYILDNFNNGMIGPPHCGTTMEQKAKIGDFVWLDGNKNGIQDSGEMGISSVTVKLFKCDGTYVSSTTTSKSGYYSFTTMPGEYYVQFMLPSGYVFTMPDKGMDDAKDSDADISTGKTTCTMLTPGEMDLTWDSGMYLKEQQMAMIGDFVWKDTDKDGVQDKGEPGIDGVMVTLYDCNSNFIASTTTKGGGYYSFSVIPGNYYVQFELPVGFKFSPKDKTTDSLDSDADPISGKTPCTTLTSGEKDLSWDAGMYEVSFSCTYTQGYWKTHSKYGPAPYDTTWGNLEDSPFFGSGSTWYGAFWAEPKNGNPYYSLAHQYMAAYLNKLNGASTSAITTTLERAKYLLDTYDTKMDTITGSVKTEFNQLADMLDKYNNGYVGPGHCSDEKMIPYLK